MAGIRLPTRDDDFFVSHGHGDLARVAPLVDLLEHLGDTLADCTPALRLRLTPAPLSTAWTFHCCPPP